MPNESPAPRAGEREDATPTTCFADGRHRFIEGAETCCCGARRFSDFPPFGERAPDDASESEFVVAACFDCGLAYGSDGWIECVLPDEDWKPISPSGDRDGSGILCITCIARRLKRAGASAVPVMLCGTEAIRAAGQDEAFNRGWGAAVRRITELESQVAALLLRWAEHTRTGSLDRASSMTRAALASLPIPETKTND